MDVPACVNHQKVDKVDQSEEFNIDRSKLAHIYKLMGDETRLTILMALKQQEMCVHELGLITGNSPSAVSHQLRKMKDGGLITSRKDGQVRYYSISDSMITTMLNDGIGLLTKHQSQAV